jgi:hypothetical protein
MVITNKETTMVNWLHQVRVRPLQRTTFKINRIIESVDPMGLSQEVEALYLSHRHLQMQ